jgi:hypothetical protein
MLAVTLFGRTQVVFDDGKKATLGAADVVRKDMWHNHKPDGAQVRVADQPRFALHVGT